MIDLIAELLAATADAHSARSLVRAIAGTLATRWPITRVELHDPPAVAVLDDGDWQVGESFAPTAAARVIAPGLSVVSDRPLPAELRDALGQVIAAATRHLDVIKRLAQVSRRAHAENRELRADLDRATDRGELVARSPAMRAVMNRVELVARHPTTVLLTGESGTGKEVIAREIHRRSPRAHRAMIRIDCGAIPDALVESELFGHERGAFTGADRAHVGAFERAHRGTLFLDEIGELPLAAQAKLLRVLQERTIRRVGGESETAVDVRLIAATNRPLAAMVEAKTFREDLFYRLDVLAIQLPPLRERRGDLGPLVAALSRELAARLDLPAPSISRAVLARLEAHDWPGNVRELMNVIERSMILDEPLALPAATARTAAPRLDVAVRVAIENALRATHGKIYGDDGAAARLGLPPATLQSKMKKLGIARQRFMGSRT